MNALLTTLVVVGLTVLTFVGASSYLSRFRVERPPMGTVNSYDVILMMVFVVLMPLVYMGLPRPVTGALLVVLALAVLSLAGAPVMGRAAFAVAALVVSLDVLLHFTGPGWAFALVNNVVVGLLVIGATNTWVQGGMRPADVVLWGWLLAVYDVVVTGFLPMMGEFYASVVTLPLAPVVSWKAGSQLAVLGMGDLLVATLWVLVTLKAWGRRAAIESGGLFVAALLALHVLFATGVLTQLVPVMLVFGPVIAVHARWLKHRNGDPRTWWQYEQALLRVG